MSGCDLVWRAEASERDGGGDAEDHGLDLLGCDAELLRCEDRRLDAAWADRVDTDVERGELLCPGSGQREGRGLAAAYTLVPARGLIVAGTLDFAKRFSGRMVRVFMDIRWVLSEPQWTVNVTKVGAGRNPKSGTSWWGRTLNLDSNDLRERTRCVGPAKDQICQPGSSRARVRAFRWQRR